MLKKLKNMFIGKDLDPTATDVFHKLSLVAFLAWVGLGADGLSSSAYGPEEAYRALGMGHEHLALYLAIATALTVFIIAISYIQIIELFPSGGGGYTVASKLLGPKAGVVSGSSTMCLPSPSPSPRAQMRFSAFSPWAGRGPSWGWSSSSSSSCCGSTCGV
jgi:amino acid transporter